MTLAIWIVPLALSALVVAVAALASIDGGSESPRSGWSLALDGFRIAGVAFLALGGLAAIWIGVGDHQLRSVLAGRAPFDWAAACAIGVGSALIGGSLLLADWFFRRSRPSSTPAVQDAVSSDERQAR